MIIPAFSENEILIRYGLRLEPSYENDETKAIKKDLEIAKQNHDDEMKLLNEEIDELKTNQKNHSDKSIVMSHPSKNS